MSLVMMRFNRSFLKLSKDVPKLASCRFFSSEESPVNNLLGNSFYRTEEYNPLAHAEQHIGKIYSVRHFFVNFGIQNIFPKYVLVIYFIGFFCIDSK